MKNAPGHKPKTRLAAGFRLMIMRHSGLVIPSP